VLYTRGRGDAGWWPSHARAGRHRSEGDIVRESKASRFGTRSTAVVLALATVALTSLVGTALAQSDSGSSAAKPTTFIYGEPAPNSSLNPMVGYLGIDYQIWSLEYNLPIEFSTKDFGPDYAHSITTKVDTASDNMTFTYHMRSGLKWSDGQPFTAHDVAWTLNYYKEHHISNYALDLGIFKSADAPNDTTFVIHSEKPTSVFNGNSVWMYEFILPEHIWSKIDEPKKFENVPTVGSGPWVVTQSKPGDFVKLERNKYYWGPQVGLDPSVDVIIEKIFNDENQMAAALQNGEIDFAFFDSANILNSLKSKPNVATWGAQIPLFDELAFNTGSAFETNPAGGFTKHGTGSHAAADPAFRRAIAEAIDKQALVQKVYGGYASVADSPVQPAAVPAGAHWDPPPDQALNFNLDKAKADLTAAGYTDTDGDGWVNDPVTKQDVVLKYYTRTTDQNTVKTAPFVKSWLNQIGVKLNIQSVSSGKLTSIIEAGDYDMFHWGWFPNPDPNYILGIFVCSERAPKAGVYGNNDSFFCDPEYDKLYDQQLTALTTQDRLDVIHKMQQILYEQQPYIMLAYTNYLEAYRTDRFTGYIKQPANIGDLLATWGAFSYINIHPVSATAGSPTSSGISAGVWIAIVAVVIVVIAVIVLARRRTTDEDVG
jgi:peptide/nickel transport system substrate-binding protein